MKNLNDTIFCSNTTEWLEGKGILPATWELPERAKTQLLELNVGLLAISSPEAAYDPRKKKAEKQQERDPSKTHQDYEGLVILDKVLFDQCELSPKECVAAILHEFGHHVYPDGDHGIACADDYLRGKPWL